MSFIPSNATCVATTRDAFCKTIAECHTARGFRTLSQGCNGSESNLFREAQFSDDGTTIITHNEDQLLRTFVLPPDLLDGGSVPQGLKAYAQGPSPSNIHSYAIYPHYDLQDPSMTLVLSASAEQPILLTNALDYSTVHAKYLHVNTKTEAYIASNSLAFTRDGQKFLAGSKDRLALFDCSRDGSGPVSTHRTSASRKARELYNAPSMGCRGIVSSLSISSDGVLAAGTTQREIGLYEHEGQGECITAFSVASPRSDGGGVERGTGVTSVKWSPCGRYLIVAERQCDSMQVYDIRNTSQWVSRLAGRKAETTQRLGVDVVPTAEGYEVWAGGTDGCVRVWYNPGRKADEHSPDAEMALHRDPVSSTIWHPGGAVLATCSGQRFERYAVDDDSLSDSSASNSSEESSSERHSSSPRMSPTTSTQALRGLPDNRLNIWLP